MLGITRLVGSSLGKSLRLSVFSPLNPLVNRQIIYHPSFRWYTKKDDTDRCKIKPAECKPKEKKECKPPTDDKCQRKPLPYIQSCAKPNLMSDCPKPDCPYEECEPKKNNYMWFALLALAATLGALYYVFSTKQEKKDTAPLPTVKRSFKLTRPKVPQKIPATSADIPKEVPYLLIGGGTASFAAFRAIKSNDPKAKVLVISNEEQLPYMRPPLSKELWFSDDPKASKTLDFKQWNGTQRSLFYEPNDFYANTKDLMVSENGGVAVARGWTVSHLDVVNKKAFLEDGCEISYDKCLIATGSLPKNLDIFEKADDSVIKRTALFRTVFDFQCVTQRLKHAKSIAIVGGGFLGSELACAFARKTKDNKEFKVYQVFKEGGHMGAILPEYLSFWTTEKVKSEGVEVVSTAEVIGVSATSDCVTLQLSNGKSIVADLVIVAVGGAPNTDMAGKSSLETDPVIGGYLVNTELQARSNLYVAGDAACFYDPRLGRRRIEHHDNAVISGRLAGENMTGAAKPYLHQSMFWSDLGPDISYEAIGIVNSSLPTVGVFAKSNKQQPNIVEEAAAQKTEPEIPAQCKQFIGQVGLEDEKAKKEKDKDNAKQAEEEEKKRKAAAAARPGEDFSKGVIFYLRDDIIVGIVLWNVFNRMSIARQVLKDERKYEDLNEVAKLFNIHEE